MEDEPAIPRACGHQNYGSVNALATHLAVVPICILHCTFMLYPHFQFHPKCSPLECSKVTSYCLRFVGFWNLGASDGSQILSLNGIGPLGLVLVPWLSTSRHPPFRASHQPPLSQDPAYAPGVLKTIEKVLQFFFWAGGELDL